SIAYLWHICRGMQAAHQVKIIHCDLKPPNVLSSDARTVKIVDFGLTAAVSALRAADDVLTCEAWPSQSKAVNMNAMSRDGCGWLHPPRRCPHVFPAGGRAVSPCSCRSHSLPFPQVVTMAE